MCVYIYIYIYIYIHIHIYIYVYICVYMYIYMYVYIHIHTYIYIYISVCVCVCVCVCVWKRNMKFFSNETLNFFFKKFWASCILDLTETVRTLRILSQKSLRNFGIKELWALENHVLANMLLYSSHFTEVIRLPFLCPSYLDALLRLPSSAHS